jgi:serine/alanine adding enzyme
MLNPMAVIKINTAGKDAWDHFVHCSPEATYAQLYGWKNVLQESYGQPSFNFECWDGDELVGIMPVFHFKSMLFGNQLVSMPYLDTGGPLFKDQLTCQDLLNAVKVKALELGSDVCLRSLDDNLCDWPRQTEKVTMHLPLQQEPDQMLKVFSSARRNRIKKAVKNGLKVSFHREDGLDRFYNIFTNNMRDLGSPVHSKKFFKEILATFKDETGLLVVYDIKDKPIGAGLYFRFNDLLALPWVSSLRDSFKLNPNIIMYWELIKWGCQTGAKTFDFGRSSLDSGTYEYKRQWGANPVPLFWYHHLKTDGRSIEAINSSSKKNQLLIDWWKKLPLSVANFIGPKLRKSISL